jgi:hypothetical protein
MASLTSLLSSLSSPAHDQGDAEDDDDNQDETGSRDANDGTSIHASRVFVRRRSWEDCSRRHGCQRLLNECEVCDEDVRSREVLLPALVFSGGKC